jgi:hypothetical protein
MTEKTNTEKGLFTGTLLGKVQDLVEKGDFAIVTGSAEEGEKVVAEMTPLEKAIFTLADRTLTAEDAKRIMSVSCEQCKSKDGKHDKDTCLKIRALDNIEALKYRKETLSNLGWYLIRDRLNIRGGCLSLRPGFKIAKFENKDSAKPGMKTSIIIVEGFPFPL